MVQAYRPLRPAEKLRELHAAMEGLVAMGWLRAEMPENPTRPPAAWTVNPTVLSRFAVRGAEERQRRDRVRAEIAGRYAELHRARA